MFSRRLPLDLGPNALARLRENLGEVPFDLTLSNPTRCGVRYPSRLLSGLSQADGLVYRPDPLGLEKARQAVADEQWRNGRRVDPESMVLTASTSEAYALLFKLLCDPGQAVLVPAPSYPLFAHLTALENVRAAIYPLDPAGDWQPDLSHCEAEGARAIVVVHPGNPTGTYLTPEAAAEVGAFCAERNLALIADEVFLDYPLGSGEPARSFAGTAETLTFTLGGLSKHVGLPQLKLGWIALSGPAADVREALARLAFIADSYLSVGTPVQLALSDLFLEGACVRAAIRERCRRNLDALRSAVGAVSGTDLIEPRAGWSAVLRYPNVIDEEALALELLREDGVAVYPGYFFDFASPGYLALSLLPDSAIFAEGAERVLTRIARHG